jgi:hypothetical protein
MSRAGRVQRAVTLIQNLATQALTAAVVAAVFERRIRNDNSFTLEQALNATRNNWEQLLSEIRGGSGYDLHLHWIIGDLEYIQEIAASIDVAKVAEVRRLKKSSTSIFESKLAEIQQKITQSISGIWPCYHTLLAEPEKLHVQTISLLGDVNKCAKAMGRLIWILKTPFARWLILDLRPVTLLIASALIFILIYLFRTSGAASPSTVSQDVQRFQSIWEAQDRGFVPKLRGTIDLISQVASIFPVILGLCSLFLLPVRLFLVKSKKRSAQIETVQAHLQSVARAIGLGRSGLINIQEVTMSGKITTVGPVGPGAILNVAEYMNNVTNTVTQTVGGSNQSKDVKALVVELAARLKEASSSIDSTKAQQMASDLEVLAKEMSQPQPRKKWYELSLDGLKQAAEAIGAIGKPILETISKLQPLLMN